MPPSAMGSNSIPNDMLEAHISPETTVKLHRSPIPAVTAPSHVLVRVHAAACNPKDWKMPAGILKTIGDCPNSGDDVAGVVVAVGSGVHNLRVGDRVAGLHELGNPVGGAYAEYALVHEQSAWRLADHVSFEEAAGTPMASLMASIGLFAMLKIVQGPWEEVRGERPLLLYGGATAVGSMAIKIAVAAGIHPIIVVAGGGADHVKDIIDPSKGDSIVDYRHGSDATVQAIKAALAGRKLMYAFDTVSMKDSFSNVAQVLDPQGKVTIVLPQLRPEFRPEQQSNTMAGMLFKKLTTRDPNLDVGQMGGDCQGDEFGHMASSWIGRSLASGALKPNPFEVVGGLDSLESALQRLRQGKVSAKKLVIKVRDD